MHLIRLSSRTMMQQGICDRPRRFLLHPTMIGPYHNCLVSSKTLTDFFEGTATAGSDVVQSGRPIFDDFFQHLWPYIGKNTANVVFQNGQAFVAYPHRPMTLHSPTKIV
ncbi:hypothetical protein TNCV_2447281 [Trichonephila clavipes]|uniref:Uncharacterized protein n=1 Tax=Trichonephila clavipes TaxID=2585209 RepID=A0A8X6SNZ6_TRICX|nr:hypothetical protein TNCV_2447281 [Trichonephila clavipes]